MNFDHYRYNELWLSLDYADHSKYLPGQQIIIVSRKFLHYIPKRARNSPERDGAEEYRGCLLARAPGIIQAEEVL
jgi:hypothetical protein